MQTGLSWKKGVFSNLYTIYSNGVLVGQLKDKSFTQSGIGVLNNKEYLFETKGFLNQKTHIIDTAENKTVGEITYNGWRTKATITINDKTINWKYDNGWNTKWSISDSEGINIKYAGSSTSGQIETNTNDALLLLSGLFITNYYWHMTIIVLIAIFIPILAN